MDKFYEDEIKPGLKINWQFELKEILEKDEHAMLIKVIDKTLSDKEAYTILTRSGKDWVCSAFTSYTREKVEKEYAKLRR